MVASSTAAAAPTNLSASLPGADDLAAPLASYLEGQGLAQALKERPPRVQGKPLDLCKLYREVKRLGGFHRVAAGERWPAVAEALFPSASTGGSGQHVAKASAKSGGLGAMSLAVTLSVAYRRFLLGYEAVEEQEQELQLQLQASQQSLQQLEAGQAGDDAAARGLKRPRPGGGSLSSAQEFLGKARSGSIALPGGGAAGAGGMVPGSVAAMASVAEASRLERVNEAVAVLAAARPDAASEVRAINLLNKLSADGDHELLVDSCPGLLDALADALDRHNAALLRLLRGRLARQHPPHPHPSSSAAAAASHHHHHHHRHHHHHPPKAEEGSVDDDDDDDDEDEDDEDEGPSTLDAQAALAFQARFSSRGGGSLSPPWLDPADRALLRLDPGPIVLGLVSVLRNLAYIVANEEPLAYHPRLLAHLVSLLPCGGTPRPGGSGPLQQYHLAAAASHHRKTGVSGPALTGSNVVSAEAGAYAADVLVALARVLDVNGIPVSEEDLLATGGVPEDSLMALAPPAVRARCAPQTRDPQHQEFVALVLDALPTLIGLVGEEDRPCVLRALECLARLLALEDNARLVARHAPGGFFLRLHELLYVPAEGPDAMPAYSGAPVASGNGSSGRGQQQEQAEQQQAAAGAEAGEGEAPAIPPRYVLDPKTLGAVGLDGELRDASLEVLELLCAARESHARLLAHAPGLLRSLVLLLRTGHGRGASAAAAASSSSYMGPRPEAAYVAARVVVALASEGEGGGSGGRGRREMEGLRPLLTYYALRPGGEVAAEVLWAVFLAPPPAPGEGEEGGEEGGESEAGETAVTGMED